MVDAPLARTSRLDGWRFVGDDADGTKRAPHALRVQSELLMTLIKLLEALHDANS